MFDYKLHTSPISANKYQQNINKTGQQKRREEFWLEIAPYYQYADVVTNNYIDITGQPFTYQVKYYNRGKR